MSVFTSVSESRMAEFLRSYGMARLISQQGLPQGIENTNYHVVTDQGEFVVTLFETVPAEALPFCIDYMSFVADHGLPAPRPRADIRGNCLRRLADRDAVMVDFLPGETVTAPDFSQCAAVGDLLGRMHQLAPHFPGKRVNPRGPEWREAMAAKVRRQLSTTDQELLDEALAHSRNARPGHLPGGVVHCDVFRDNVLFERDRLTGLVDFYYSCEEAFIYDLAVAANDWCTDDQGVVVHSRLKALLDGYYRHRSLTAEEAAVWSEMLVAAAFRFWLSRKHDRLFPRPGAMTFAKDPGEFRRILLSHIYYPDRSALK